MKSIVILITIVLMALTVSSSPIDHQYPKSAQFHIERRSSPQQGASFGVKGQPQLTNLDYTVRKGEYVCGNRICKLKPGEIPKGCNGICQYPI